MDAARIRRHFVAVIAKHLPPSGSSLRLLDLDGCTGELLSELRADLEICRILAPDIGEGDIALDSADAIVAFDLALGDELLEFCLAALRQGGRFIALQSRGGVSESHLRQLRDHGFVRILIEPALDELGVLIRGEKPHAAADTMARIKSVARADADSLDLYNFSGRYVHLLIQQRPNKPAWTLAPGEAISWRAAAVNPDSKPLLLGFSSLPKAVAFMQPAILAGVITDINKVGKFSLETAKTLDWNIILNPTLESLRGNTLTFLHVEPALAEAPDE